MTPRRTPRTGRPIPPATLIVLAGVALRLAAYVADRPYWSDEVSLRDNLVGVAPWDLGTPLRNSQLAPPLFLVMERALIGAFGPSRMVARALPLAASLAGLVLFRRLADRVLSPGAALLALALLALSDEQIYFATELKPYAVDVAVAVGIGLGAVSAIGERRGVLHTLRGWVAFVVMGCVALGLSFPAAFGLAAAGLAGVVAALRRRDMRSVAGWLAAGATWAAALGATRAVSLRLLGGDGAMWRFWEFAFPPPIGADPLWVPRRLLFLFVCPLDWHGPFDPRWAALPAIGCAAVGVAWLGRRRPVEALALVGPLGFALLAAALRLYPFHGRCLLFAAPALLLTVAAGAGVIGSRLGRVAWALLVVALLAYAAALDLHALIEPRQRMGFHPVGDRRPARIGPDLFVYP